MKCKICGATEADFIGKPRHDGNFPDLILEKYGIFQCRNCKFYFIHPEISLTRDDWQVLYDKSYFANTRTTDWHKRLREKERKSRIDLIRKYSTHEIRRFLDIGCGEGFILLEALRNGFEAYGVDIVDNLDPSVDRNLIDYSKGDIFDSLFPDAFFDAVYMDSVLEHVDRPLDTLKEIHRILKPSAIAFLIVPNEDSLINGVKEKAYTLMMKRKRYGRIKPFVPPYHINGFNRTSLEYAIRQAGFTPVELTQFGGDYPLWKARKRFTRSYFAELILYPFNLLSIPLGKQIQLQAIIRK
jgi:SAM-dependent methyltransferase